MSGANFVPRFGLATKITIPFILLFALLLSGLGYVLSRGIIRDLEVHMVRRLGLTLSIAMDERCQFSGFWETLRERVAGEDTDIKDLQLVALEDGKSILTTFDLTNPQEKKVVDALKELSKDTGHFPGLIKPNTSIDPESKRKPLSAKELRNLIETGQLRDNYGEAGEIRETRCALAGMAFINDQAVRGWKSSCSGRFQFSQIAGMREGAAALDLAAASIMNSAASPSVSSRSL